MKIDCLKQVHTLLNIIFYNFFWVLFTTIIPNQEDVVSSQVL